MAECITDKDSSYCYMTEEELKEAKMNRVARLTVVAAAAALLFSFVAISNLNHDVYKTLKNKVASVENRLEGDVAPRFKEKVRIENTY
jgi:cytochrome bd-type quinol oxidase subunit 1